MAARHSRYTARGWVGCCTCALADGRDLAHVQTFGLEVTFYRLHVSFRQVLVVGGTASKISVPCGNDGVMLRAAEHMEKFVEFFATLRFTRCFIEIE